MLSIDLQSVKLPPQWFTTSSAITGSGSQQAGAQALPVPHTMWLPAPAAHLSTNLPPTLRAYSQLNSAVRAPPTCKLPVGEGAKRTLICAQAYTQSTPHVLVQCCKFTLASRRNEDC
eukprot:GHRQ01023867.1.p2 GENE.GHRQ01023867.1~~GHRQ01023867.1.p2  ORF type:complete len:117 (-),score=12.65 GHRQ01023867.1:266-616(-)